MLRQVVEIMSGDRRYRKRRWREYISESELGARKLEELNPSVHELTHGTSPIEH